MYQSSFQVVVDRRSFSTFKLGSNWSLDKSTRLCHIHGYIVYFQISIFIDFILYFYHLVILNYGLYIFISMPWHDSKSLAIFLDLSMSWLLLLEYPIEGLLRLLLLWIKLFFWVRGRPCFKWYSVKISVEFQVLEYFLKFKVYNE